MLRSLMMNQNGTQQHKKVTNLTTLDLHPSVSQSCQFFINSERDLRCKKVYI